jgi:hypothetical protein
MPVVDVSRLAWQWVVALRVFHLDYLRAKYYVCKNIKRSLIQRHLHVLARFMLHMLHTLCLEDVRLQPVYRTLLRRRFSCVRPEADLADDCALFGQLSLMATAYEMLNGTCFHGG